MLKAAELLLYYGGLASGSKVSNGFYITELLFYLQLLLLSVVVGFGPISVAFGNIHLPILPPSKPSILCPIPGLLGHLQHDDQTKPSILSNSKSLRTFHAHLRLLRLLFLLRSFSIRSLFFN